MAGKSIYLAGPAEDGALRAVLRESSMPGPISLAFTREPSFFIAEQAGNLRYQTLTYADSSTGRLIGVAGRSMRRLYVDGASETIGYLSTLRLLPKLRSTGILARGYRLLRELHRDGQVPYYLTSILANNRYARTILESGRVGLPAYIPIGTFVTHCISLRRAPRMHKDPEVRRCPISRQGEAIDFLDGWNRSHSFAPVYTRDDIEGATSLLPGISPANLYVYLRDDTVAGTIGVWDQTFKQTVVTGYSRAMQAIRPFYNTAAYVRGLPPLPPVGGRIRSLYASLVSAADDDPRILAQLVDAVRRDWSGRGYDYLLVGLATDSPLNRAMRSRTARRLTSIIYLVAWPDDEPSLPRTTDRMHLEIATL